MDQTSGSGANDSLCDDTLENFSLLDDYIFVFLVDIVAITLLEVDSLWDDQTEDLLAGPKWLGLNDSRLWQAFL